MLVGCGRTGVLSGCQMNQGASGTPLPHPLTAQGPGGHRLSLGEKGRRCCWSGPSRQPFVSHIFLPDHDFNSWPCSPERFLHPEGLFFFFVPEYLSSEASGSFLIKMLNIFGSGTSAEEELHFRYK